MRKNYIILFLVLISIIFTGCSSESSKNQPMTVSEKLKENQKPTDVIIEVETVQEGKQLLLEGKATLPDGSILSLQVNNKNDFMILESNATVSSEKWTQKVDISQLKPGTAEIWIAFQTVLGNNLKQPQDVIKKYGELGEKITGKYSVESGNLKRAEIIKSIEIK